MLCPYLEHFPLFLQLAHFFYPFLRTSFPEKPSLKPVEAVDGDAPVVLPVLMRLARWMAQYYLAPVERCIQTLLHAPVRSGRSREKAASLPMTSLSPGTISTTRAMSREAF